MAKKKNRYFLNAQVRGKKFKDDQREFDFEITDDTRDTYGTVFTHDGWSFDAYKRNPVVFYQHRSNDDDPDNLIGMTIKGPWAETRKDGSKVWVARMLFEEEEVNAKAEKIRKKIIAGTLRMASIGADIYEYHWGDEEKKEDPDTVYLTDKELFEWSIVNIGSNGGAHVRNTEFISVARGEKPSSDDGVEFELTKGKKIKRKKHAVDAEASKKSKKRSKRQKKKGKKRKKQNGLNIQADLIEIAKLKS